MSALSIGFHYSKEPRSVWKERGWGRGRMRSPGQSADSLHWTFEIAGRLELKLIRHRVDLEPVQPGDKLVSWPFGPVFWVHHEQHVRKPCSEVGSVRVMVAGRFWGVHVHAFGAIELHHGLPRDVGKTNWKHGLVFTVDTGTVPEISLLVLLKHLCDASVREYVTGMDEAIQHLSCLLNQVTLVWVILQLLIWLKIQDHV